MTLTLNAEALAELLVDSFGRWPTIVEHNGALLIEDPLPKHVVLRSHGPTTIQVSCSLDLGSAPVGVVMSAVNEVNLGTAERGHLTMDASEDGVTVVARQTVYGPTVAKAEIPAAIGQAIELTSKFTEVFERLLEEHAAIARHNMAGARAAASPLVSAPESSAVGSDTSQLMEMLVDSPGGLAGFGAPHTRLDDHGLLEPGYL